MRRAKVFTGSSHVELSNLIADKLGMPSAPVTVSMNQNRETSVDLGVSVRGDDIFIIQSGSECINDHLMELLILINSCKIASAARITAIIPYFPYSKQSKKKKARGAITAKSNMLTVAGADHIITMDLHHDQMQGFFSKPIDNLLAEPSITKYIQDHVPNYRNGVVVSKNAGGVKRVTSLADRLKIDFALIHKDSVASLTNPMLAASRLSKSKSSIILDPSTSARPASTELMNLQTADSANGASSSKSPYLSHMRETTTIDETENTIQVCEVIEKQWHEEGMQLVGDVDRKIAFIVDDILDKAESFVTAAKLLKKRGAQLVYVVATHGILSGDAIWQMEQCDAIHQVIVTNSYPIQPEKRNSSSKLRVIDISTVLAEAIRRTHNGESISYLFHTPM
ncbi:ribose-phosphate pyrophosphokinase 1 [Sorochytrium milnesiophthora]